MRASRFELIVVSDKSALCHLDCSMLNGWGSESENGVKENGREIYRGREENEDYF